MVCPIVVSFRLEYSSEGTRITPLTVLPEVSDTPWGPGNALSYGRSLLSTVRVVRLRSGSSVPQVGSGASTESFTLGTRLRRYEWGDLGVTPPVYHSSTVRGTGVRGTGPGCSGVWKPSPGGALGFSGHRPFSTGCPVTSYPLWSREQDHGRPL